MIKKIINNCKKRQRHTEVVDNAINKPIEAITKTIYKEMGNRLTHAQCYTLAEAIVYDDLELASTVLTSYNSKRYYN